MAYNFALETHDLVQLRYVMDYLENCFDKYPGNKRIAGEERILYNFYRGLKEVVKRQMREENPNLEQMKKMLKKYLIDRGEKSCGIIFVRSRTLTQALTSWLNECGEDEIKQLNATVFTGTAASVEQGGMTVKEQQEIIRKFRSGQVRLLVATSVGEEGFDIPECNLILKYNHVGNEVTTVQTRGRSRKEGGMSVLLGMDQILNKEKKNLEKAEMMERAIEKVSQMGRPDIQKHNAEFQRDVLEKKETKERNKSKQRPALIRKSFNMVCPHCDDDNHKLVIRCEDIRTIQGTHHVVVDSKILSRVKGVPDESHLPEVGRVVSVICWCQTKAGEPCGYKLGRITRYDKVSFVVLGINYFVFDDSEQRDGKSFKSYKTWKNFPYAIDEITAEDIKKYSPEQKDVDQTGGQDNSKEKTDNDNNGCEDKENKSLSEHAKLDQATGFSSPVNPNAADQDNAIDSHSKLNRPQEFHKEQNNFMDKAEEALGNNLSMISGNGLSADEKFQTHSTPLSSQPLQISRDSNSESMSQMESPASADSTDTSKRFSCSTGNARNNNEKEEGTEDDTQVKELELQEPHYENNEVSQNNRTPDRQDGHETNHRGRCNSANSPPLCNYFKLL